MVNMLFVYERKMATTEGVHEFFSSNDARKNGINAKFVNTWKVNGKLLFWADVIVFVRNLDLLSLWILKKAKKKGIFVIHFFDDDVLSLPKEAVNRVQFLPWRRRAIKEGFLSTDIILSSNLMLASKYSEFIPSKRYAAIDTVVDPNSLTPIQEREKHYDDNKVKIVFAAGANHEDMFDKYVKPVLPELIDRFNDKLSFTFFGVHPDMSEYGDLIDVNYYGAMPLAQYRRTIKEGFYDIGLSPLEANEFTQYKYFNKYIEYTIAGTVGIYSEVLPYTLAIKNVINGFLTENTAESWLATLCTAIENNELRRSCYKGAYDNLISEMSADRIFTKLREDIPELNQNRTNKTTISVVDLKARFIILRFVEAIYLVIEYLRSSGLSGTIKKIKSYIEDRKTVMKEKLGE